MKTAHDAANSYLASLAPGSQRAMRGALDLAACLLGHDERASGTPMPWHLIGPGEAQELRSALAASYAPATANKVLAALRGVLRECWRGGLIEHDAYARIEIKSVRGERLPRGRAVRRDELRALFATCAPSDERPEANGRRDGALIAVLYAGGLRRAEAAALALGDYSAADGALAVRKAKGNKQRTVYLAHGARAAVAAWLAVRGDAPGPLFCAVDRHGHVRRERPMTEQTIYDALRRRAGDAGIKAFSPHDLRRTFIGDLLDAGADIATVQRLAGHANVTTTARYDRRPEDTKRRAAELLDVPFAG